jgi:tetratricopeptide (TPR) repeat protein
MRSGEAAMTETRFRLKLMPCAVLVVLSVTVATADAQDCSFSDNPAAFESCSKTIAARQLRGLDLAKIYATRGLLNYFKKDNADAAIADLTEAIKIAPNFAKAYVDRGFVYDNRKRDYDRAIADYSAAIRLEPTNVEAFTRRASAYSSKSQYDLSIADYAQAIRLAPNDSSPYFSRGSTYYYHKQDYDRAIADYSETIRLNPKSATSVASRGEAYEKKGDLANAQADFSCGAGDRGRQQMGKGRPGADRAQDGGTAAFRASCHLRGPRHMPGRFRCVPGGGRSLYEPDRIRQGRRR